jgi:hypothetical protein
VACVVIALALGVFYAACCWYFAWLLGGSSLPGLVSGAVGAVLIFYEALFALRKGPVLKWWYRRWPTQALLRQHVWLGLLTVPFVAVHSGLFTRGSPLTIALLVVFFAVIASGIWGLLVQQWLPRRLLQEVPAETIASQIPSLLEQLRGEARVLVLAACGPEKDELAADDGAPAAESSSALPDRQEVVRAALQGRGAGLLAILPASPIAGTEALRHYFRHTIDPFLRQGGSGRGALRNRSRSAEEFRDLRGKLSAEAHAVVDALEALCERRRLLDEQARLHAWLHNWLLVHVPLSVTLVCLLVWHTVTAVIYW